jgi:hypothetical protein
MMRLAICLGCVAVAALFGAGFTAVPSPPTWAQVASGLRPALDPRSSNPCQRGAPSCFDIVLKELRRREQGLAKVCDHNALWADLYMLMIGQVRLTDRAGKFRNRPQVTHFDAWFARSYLDAFDNWRAGRGAVPGAWAAAFGAAARRSIRGLGDLLLGLNAHISRDLAYAVAASFPGHAKAMDPDYLLVSGLVQQVSARALVDISARFDPTIAVAELPLTVSAGQKGLGALVAVWTGEAWRNGTALRDAAPGARAAIKRKIESTAKRRARLIVAATSYLTLGGSQLRDAYCAAQRGNG